MAESKAIYLGSGKSVTGKYGEFFNVTLNLNKVKDNPQVVENFKGNQFVRLRISKKDQIDQYGNDVVVVWNQYDPSKETNNSKPSGNTTDLPF